jgi:hypothetical protein
MTNSRRREWLVPSGLVALSLVPVAAGSARLAQLAGGAAVTPENARFFDVPFPVIVHVIGASAFCLLGAFQFVPTLRGARHRWHRMSGRLIVPCGLAAALSGMWMAVFYALPANDGALLEAVRLGFGSAMVAALVLGFACIMRRDVVRHRAWMMRGYAIGLGAGTQVLTNLPWILLFGTPDVAVRALLMAAGWVINLAVAEYVIRGGWLRKSSDRPMRVTVSSVR